MRTFCITAFSVAVFTCVIAQGGDKQKGAYGFAPPDPIDPPDQSYAPVSDYYVPPDPEPKPDPIYGKPYPFDYLPKPDLYNPPVNYGQTDAPKSTPKPYAPVPPPVSEPVCKEHNICEKSGYKCCACADCNSESFGCAETCACCPRHSVCCKSGMKNHFCCPRGCECDSAHGACITVKKVKPTKADIFCGACDYYPEPEPVLYK